MAIKQRKRRRVMYQGYDAIHAVSNLYAIYMQLREEYSLKGFTTMSVFCAAVSLVERSENKCFTTVELNKKTSAVKYEVSLVHVRSMLECDLIYGSGPFFLTTKGEKLKYVLNRYFIRAIEYDIVNYKNTPRKYVKAKP